MRNISYALTLPFCEWLYSLEINTHGEIILSHNPSSADSYPDPLTVLYSLASSVHENGGRILWPTSESSLMPFLNAINQLPIETSPVKIKQEDKSYIEVVLTQTLKEGLVAIMKGDKKKIADINTSLKTQQYKALCDEPITLHDFYKALVISSDVVKCRSDKKGTSLILKPHTAELGELFKCGLNLNTPGWKLTDYDTTSYELYFSDIDAKYPVEVKRRNLLTIGHLDDIDAIYPAGLKRHTLWSINPLKIALSPNIFIEDVLLSHHSLLNTPDGLVKKETSFLEEMLNADETIEGSGIAILPVSADNFYEMIDGFLLYDSLGGLIRALLEKENILGAIISIPTEGEEYYRHVYEYDSDDDSDEYFVLIFRHPFFSNEEFHVVFKDTSYDPDWKITVLKRLFRDYDIVGDLLVTEEDCYERTELPLLDVLHFMLSSTKPPHIHFE